MKRLGVIVGFTRKISDAERATLMMGNVAGRRLTYRPLCGA